jgi:hypothetical protein
VGTAARFSALGVYAGLAAIFWSKNGVPILGDRMTVWLLGLLLAVSIANPGRFVRGLVFDWLPFLAALTVYDLSRGVADGSVLPAHARPQIWIDQYVFGFGAPCRRCSCSDISGTRRTCTCGTTRPGFSTCRTSS